MAITIENAIVVAIAIPCLALMIVIVFQWGAEQYSKRTRDAYSPETIFISAAKVATDLVPLINRLPLRSSEIWIFGTDGGYFAKPNGHKLVKAIRRWMKHGLTVRYILLQPSDGVESVLRSLIQESNCHDGSFSVSVLGDDTPSLQEILPEMRLRHPTLFFGRDGRNAMWLEGTHKENAMYAYNVRYVSPVAMKGVYQEEFERQKTKLQLLLDHSNGWSSLDPQRAA